MPIEKNCENCGATFASYPSANQRFCSLACRSAFRFDKSIPAPGREVVNFTCKECGKPFGMMRAYLNAHIKKYGRGPLYCSRPCSDIGRTKDATARNTFTCISCGETLTRSRKPGGRIYREQKYCSQACKAAHQRDVALARFNAGNFSRHIKRHGYVWISVPSLVTGKKHAVMEHRYVMSQHLGRELYPEETVHHRDGNRQHNDLSNLELFSSRHGPGQRVVDKVAFAIDMLRLYPEFARAAGVELRDVAHPTASDSARPPAPPSPSCRPAAPNGPASPAAS